MQRKCSICKKKFDKEDLRFTGIKCYCSAECGAALSLELLAKKNEAIAKKARSELKARKEKLDATIPVWTKRAQVDFNRYIRLRDKNDGCISCGRFINNDHLRGGDYDCGHYRSVGSCRELRFDPLNAHKQCKHCNRDLSGNVVEYRINLIKKIGTKKLAWLEGPHEPKRYRVEDLKQISAHYRNLIKELSK